MGNLDLWDKASTVDAKQTKKANVAGNKLTSINGLYPVMKATEQWGVVGIGWGYEIVMERFDDTGPIINSKGITITQGKLHTLLVKVWHMDGDVKSETPCHFGHTKYIYPYSQPTDSKLYVTDFEYAKKSLTDALNKCLSMFGFCADIYLGKFDDPQFVQNSQHRLEIEQAEDRDQAILDKKEELSEYIEFAIDQFKLIPNSSTLKLLLEKNINKINSICNSINIDPSVAVKLVREGCKLKLEELKQKKLKAEEKLIIEESKK